MSVELIDRIYECAMVPELWPEVLHDLAGVADARGGLVFSARKTVSWSASDGVHSLFDEYFSDGWFDRCSRRVCSMGAEKPTFMVEHDFWTEDQLAQDPMYRDLFRPHGVGWGTWTGLRMPTGDEIVVSLERPLSRGPIEREHVDRLNTIRPHLVRSALVAGRMELQRAKGATDALTRLGLPAVLVDAKGRAVETNPLIEAMGETIRVGAGDQVVLSDPKAQARLAAALASSAVGPDAASCSVPLRDADGQAQALLHVMPIRRSAHDIFGLSYALVLITPITPTRVPRADLLTALFNLTPAEIRVAQELASGTRPEEMATKFGVGLPTIRSQMRGVFEKMGCTRQAEVAAVLTRLSIAPDG